MTNGIVKCVNCERLPKQHMNKETKTFILKCPNCHIKTNEFVVADNALHEWNEIHGSIRENKEE